MPFQTEQREGFQMHKDDGSLLATWQRDDVARRTG
jgi:hypothetical protein